MYSVPVCAPPTCNCSYAKVTACPGSTVILSYSRPDVVGTVGLTRNEKLSSAMIIDIGRSFGGRLRSSSE